MKLKVIIKGASQIEQVAVEFDESCCLVGRVDADIELNDPRCSRQHALFFEGPDHELHIRDLESRNGTSLNGEKIQQAKVTVGDEIQIGKSILVIAEFDGAMPAPNSRQSVLQEDPDTKTGTGIVINSWPGNFKALRPSKQERFVSYVNNDGSEEKRSVHELAMSRSSAIQMLRSKK